MKSAQRTTTADVDAEHIEQQYKQVVVSRRRRSSIAHQPKNSFIVSQLQINKNKDESMKVSSTRLKPDEASAILQEDGDEARVGSLSIQIMAKVSQQEQEQEQEQQEDEMKDESTVPVQSTTASGVPTAAGKVGASSKPVGLHAARGSGLVRRKLGASSSSRLGPAGLLSPRTAAAPLVGVGTGSTSGISGGSSATAAGASAADARPPTSAAASSAAAAAAAAPLKRTGLGGGGRGLGGARRFHAPRLSWKAGAAAASGGAGTPNANPSTSAPAWSKRTGRPSASGAGSLGATAADRGSAGAANAATIAGARAAAERISGNHRGGGAASTGTATPAAVDPEGLVLEWTAGNPPQPVLAGASLARRLHPHQREGLKVLWDCLAGRGGCVCGFTLVSWSTKN